MVADNLSLLFKMMDLNKVYIWSKSTPTNWMDSLGIVYSKNLFKSQKKMAKFD